jgi:hypothetical protein
MPPIFNFSGGVLAFVETTRHLSHLPPNTEQNIQLAVWLNYYLAYTRSETFLVVNIHILALWVMIWFSLVGGYKRLGRAYCLYLGPEWQECGMRRSLVYLWRRKQCFSEILLPTWQITRRHNLEDHNIYIYCSNKIYCRVLEWLSAGFWIGYWIHWPLTGSNNKQL